MRRFDLTPTENRLPLSTVERGLRGEVEGENEKNNQFT